MSETAIDRLINQLALHLLDATAAASRGNTYAPFWDAAQVEMEQIGVGLAELHKESTPKKG